MENYGRMSKAIKQKNQLNTKLQIYNTFLVKQRIGKTLKFLYNCSFFTLVFLFLLNLDKKANKVLFV